MDQTTKPKFFPRLLTPQDQPEQKSPEEAPAPPQATNYHPSQAQDQPEPEPSTASQSSPVANEPADEPAAPPTRKKRKARELPPQPVSVQPEAGDGSAQAQPPAPADQPRPQAKINLAQLPPERRFVLIEARLDKLEATLGLLDQYLGVTIENFGRLHNSHNAQATAVSRLELHLFALIKVLLDEGMEFPILQARMREIMAAENLFDYWGVPQPPPPEPAQTEPAQAEGQEETQGQEPDAAA